MHTGCAQGDTDSRRHDLRRHSRGDGGSRSRHVADRQRRGTRPIYDGAHMTHSTNELPGLMTRSEAELRQMFLKQVEVIPGGERIKRCIQCGTCTGSCPVSHAMDISPRQIIALFRAGEIETIMKSRSIWICASCYACTTRCP